MIGKRKLFGGLLFLSFLGVSSYFFPIFLKESQRHQILPKSFSSASSSSPLSSSAPISSPSKLFHKSEISISENPQVFINGHFVPSMRLVHLDLKGAPPQISYLTTFVFPLLSKAGATGLLIEYEDMFPYSGNLANLSAKNSYTPSEIHTLLLSASNHHLVVIPLLQTFGHLEHVLKLKEFGDLREVPNYPQSICPSQEKSFEILSQMIDQVLSFHPEASWLHIGSDEVYQLGQCSLCTTKMARQNDVEGSSYADSRTLFLSHVQRIASYVRRFKGVIPIMWDDMLRSFPSQSLLEYGLGTLVEPMVWVYIEEVDRFIDSLTWSNYAEVFPHIWTASAFKGAFGERHFQVNIRRHVGNHLSWLEVMSRESSREGSRKIHFRGIALSGWSRYDHFAVLCELLPSALPSLILNLGILSYGVHDHNSVNLAQRLLGCPPSQNSLFSSESLASDPFQRELARCGWSGSELFALLNAFRSNKFEIQNFLNRIDSQEGWLTDYNVLHQYSSPYRIHEIMKSISFFPGILRNLENEINKTLHKFYDKYTVNEWIEQNFTPLQSRLEEVSRKARILVEPLSWPRRPIE